MTESLSTPQYESKGTFRSLWNKYTIFEDRIELQFRLFFTKVIIPKKSFNSADIFKPPVIRTVFWALKLDLADFYTHIGIKKKSGVFKKIRFTPENPQEFLEKVNEWIDQ